MLLKLYLNKKKTVITQKMNAAQEEGNKRNWAS
jgi:hypothetical protein